MSDICSETGPCWNGYVYIGPKHKAAGSCISKAKLCNKKSGRGIECKTKINCDDQTQTQTQTQTGGQQETINIPEDVRKEALKGLQLISNGFKGGTETGWARAHQLSGTSIDSTSLADMRTWFARHGPDANSGGTSYPGYRRWIDDGSPTNNGHNLYRGAVSWLIWGGDAAYKWLKTDKIRTLLREQFPNRKEASIENNLV